MIPLIFFCWCFIEVASYGRVEHELIHIPANVIQVEDRFYMLDAGLSQIVEIVPGTDAVVHSIEGDGPGQCRNPNTIEHIGDWFLLLRPLKATIIHSDLTFARPPPPSLRMTDILFARNLKRLEQGGYLVNGLFAYEGQWIYELALLGEGGERIRAIVSQERAEPNQPFPPWFYRNTWAAGPGRIAIATGPRTVEVRNMRGDWIEARTVEGKVGPCGTAVQSMVFIDGDLYVMPRSTDPVLIGPSGRIALEGVQHGPGHAYYWLDKYLAVIAGFDGKIFGPVYGDEELELVIYRRQR